MPHALPHVPQFFGSSCVFVHVPLQFVSAIAMQLQIPILQTRLLPQTFAHFPQLFGSLFVSTQTPLQSTLPIGHVHLPL